MNDEVDDGDGLKCDWFHLKSFRFEIENTYPTNTVNEKACENVWKTV